MSLPHLHHWLGCLFGLVLSARGAQAQSATVVLEGVATRGHATTLEDTNPVLDAGVVDALGVRVPENGRIVRWQRQKGAYLVWTFKATVRHDGETARFELEAAGPDSNGLRCAPGTNTRWERPRAGIAVLPLASVVLFPAVVSGQSVYFQLAMPLRDNAPLRTLRPGVRYRAVVNGEPASHRKPILWPTPRERLPRYLPSVPRSRPR